MRFDAIALPLTGAVTLALVAGYVLFIGRQRRYAVVFTDMETLDLALAERPPRRRHAASAALLLAAISLALATGRPSIASASTTEVANVYLVVDTSLSMGADDVEPTRIEAARQAARAFLEAAPDDVAVGLVLFAGTATVTVPPTPDRLPIKAALDRFALGQGTATGDALEAALRDAVGDDDPSSPDAGRSETDQTLAHIVLLSDGDRTLGLDPLPVAERAASLGVRVSTVVLGTPDGEIDLDGVAIAVPVDSGTLAEIAEITGGTMERAATSDQLQSVFTDLARTGVEEAERTDVTHLFALGGLVLLMLGAAGLARWSPLLP